jgi:hypothetical protein
MCKFNKEKIASILAQMEQLKIPIGLSIQTEHS